MKYESARTCLSGNRESNEKIANKDSLIQSGKIHELQRFGKTKISEYVKVRTLNIFTDHMTPKYSFTINFRDKITNERAMMID